MIRFSFSNILITLFLIYSEINSVKAQSFAKQWSKDGYHFYESIKGNITSIDARDPGKTTIILPVSSLIIRKKDTLKVQSFTVTDDEQKVLIFTNTKKVWRLNTRGDYWLFDKKTNTLKQLGKSKPASSLMFAKLSPDENNAAYVSGHNLYVEDLATGNIKPLTTNGTKKLINGTFDWAYEEEFDCRDGFRWSPDSRSIAYWQIDATKIPFYLMLNTTDSVYSHTVPVEYPVSGTDPSACRIGVVDVATGKNKWMNIPGDVVQNYIPGMAWAENSNELVIEQLNRAQNQSRVIICNVSNATARVIYKEEDKAWIDSRSGMARREITNWNWIEKGKSFLWLSEKDGWRHIYKINRDGQSQLITRGDYDVIGISAIDEINNLIYFIASPENATQKYLYKVAISGDKSPERVSPADQPGTHGYQISPNAKIAIHTFSNVYTRPVIEHISLPEHFHLSGNIVKLDPAAVKNKPEFFKVKTVDGIDLNGWMVKPTNFDPAKKYPVIFLVYGEPASNLITDSYGSGFNYLYQGNMANDGYIYMSIDNRGTPAPRGREWRKSIYKNIGTLNIRDQAMGAKEILKWPYVDSSRVAVWGWSGGGSSTLNLMFQYPEIYKTGIAIAAVGNQLTYDNIYQERYMGVPKDAEGRSYFIKGSPVTYAKNLRGNLLYIHGTGDDNVHYNNAEMLINELVKYNKRFQLMSYPNRTHSISEGEGTSLHLSTLYTQYLKEHCPPGAR